MRMICFFLLITFTGCATQFGEDHYYQSLSADPVTNETKPTNFYRLRVKGGAYFSSARYVSGYYDERAVDIFFNEIKLKPTGAGDSGTLFSENMKDPGSQEVIKPLSPNDQHGAFVMVLSTNASAVTNAIGQFAENQVVADAVTNLANQDVIRQLRGAEPAPQFEKEQAKALSTQIDNLFDLVPEGQNPDLQQTQRALLRILNTIARAKGKGAPITSFADAKKWIEEEK